METLTNPVVINLLSDDSHTDIINIGFNFCFYGNVYNQLVASTNNYLSFDIENANAYSYILSYQDFEYQIYDRANCSNCFGTITITR